MVPSTTVTIVTDIRIPFWRLVLFLIKLSLAAIPAAIVVTLILFAIGTAIAFLFGMPWDAFWRRGTLTL